MQVIGIEHRGSLERIKVVDRPRLVPQHDQARGAQLLEGAIDVHDGQAGRVGQIKLGDREGAARRSSPQLKASVRCTIAIPSSDRFSGFTWVLRLSCQSKVSSGGLTLSSIRQSSSMRPEGWLSAPCSRH